jgi:glycosyltransferase involved in cell wall biosynthesis
VERHGGARAGEWRSQQVSISLIIPAYNEAQHLSETLPRLRAEYGEDPSVEIVIVDDGSRDRTAEVAAACLRGWRTSRLIRLPWNQGKGSAIKAGVGAARGSRLVFMDADLSADPADLPRLVAALDHADVAIGSRSIAGSRVVYNQHRGVRKVQSKFFNGIACAMVNVIASDTQCGFKAFRADAGKLLFHLCEGKGFAFDVEVLALAQLLGLRITEVPVDWVESVGTTVRPVRDPILMVRDLLRTRRRCRRLEKYAGRYVWEVTGPHGGLDDAADSLASAGRWPGEQRAGNGAPEVLVDLVALDQQAAVTESAPGVAPDAPRLG